MGQGWRELCALNRLFEPHLVPRSAASSVHGASWCVFPSAGSLLVTWSDLLHFPPPRLYPWVLLLLHPRVGVGAGYQRREGRQSPAEAPFPSLSYNYSKPTMAGLRQT